PRRGAAKTPGLNDALAIGPPPRWAVGAEVGDDAGDLMRLARPDRHDAQTGATWAGRQHVLHVRGEALRVSVSEPHRRTAVGRAHENAVLRPASLPLLVEQDVLAVGRDVAKQRVIEPADITILGFAHGP